jgi:hypothetical protein
MAALTPASHDTAAYCRSRGDLVMALIQISVSAGSSGECDMKFGSDPHNRKSGTNDSDLCSATAAGEAGGNAQPIRAGRPRSSWRWAGLKAMI